MSAPDVIGWLGVALIGLAFAALSATAGADIWRRAEPKQRAVLACLGLGTGLLWLAVALK